MKINRQIRAPKVRVIDHEGNQLGVLNISEALVAAEQVGLDLVEISATAVPPVCKIIDYGKFRYQQTKKEKESKKAQHQSKLKEIKLKPNIDEHDVQVKLKKARGFIEDGDKVRVTCVFRGREILHTEYGQNIVNRFCEEMKDIASAESPAKMFGKSLSLVLAPAGKKKSSVGEKDSVKSKEENK